MYQFSEEDVMFEIESAKFKSTDTALYQILMQLKKSWSEEVQLAVFVSFDNDSLLIKCENKSLHLRNIYSDVWKEILSVVGTRMTTVEDFLYDSTDKTEFGDVYCHRALMQNFENLTFCMAPSKV
jgi:hypothetical protein